MELLKAPASFHEFACQPIEELRMRWPFAFQAEVARGRHNSAAKMILPDAIDHYASGQWILRVGQDICQSSAASAGAFGTRNHLGWIWVKQCQEAGLDFFVRLFVGAAAQDKNGRRLDAQIGHAGGQWQFARIEVRKFGKLLFQFQPALLLFPFDFASDGRFVAHIFARAWVEILMSFPSHLSLERISLRVWLL